MSWPGVVSVILCCVVLAIGDAFIMDRWLGYPVDYIAQRNLPKGTLLGAGDLAPVPFGGRYLIADVAKGQRVSASDLTAQPPLDQTQSFVPVALPLPRSLLARGLNTGAKGQICRDGKQVLDLVELRTVICPPDDTECIAILAVAPGDAGKLTPTQSGHVTVTIRPSATPCP